MGGGRVAAEPSTHVVRADGPTQAYVELSKTGVKVYPGPSLPPHWVSPWPKEPNRYHSNDLHAAWFGAEGKWVALSGQCRGSSGHSPPQKPRCLASYVRVVEVATGAVVPLLPYWHESHDNHEALAVAFSPKGDRVAALSRVTWGECSSNGYDLYLQVWETRQGGSLWHKVVAHASPDPNKGGMDTPWHGFKLEYQEDGSVVVIRRDGHRRSYAPKPPS